MVAQDAEHLQQCAKPWRPRRFVNDPPDEETVNTDSSADDAQSVDSEFAGVLSEATRTSSVCSDASTALYGVPTELHKPAKPWQPRRFANTGPVMDDSANAADSIDVDSLGMLSANTRTSSVSSDMSTASGATSASCDSGDSKRSRRVCVNYLDEPGRVEYFEVEFVEGCIREDWKENTHRQHYADLLQDMESTRSRGIQCAKSAAIEYCNSSRHVSSRDLVGKARKFEAHRDRKCLPCKDRCHRQRGGG